MVARREAWLALAVSSLLVNACQHAPEGSALTLDLQADLGDEWFERFRDDLDTFDIVQASGKHGPQVTHFYG